MNTRKIFSVLTVCLLLAASAVSPVMANGASTAEQTGSVLNYAEGTGALVIGGKDNDAAGVGAVVQGGMLNAALGVGAEIVGGHDNSARGVGAVVGGGSVNAAIGTGAEVHGGSSASVAGVGAIAGAGNFNTAVGIGVQVNAAPNPHDGPGGPDNQSVGFAAQAGGGVYNRAIGAGAQAVFGDFNTALGTASYAGGSGWGDTSSYNTAVGAGAYAYGGSSVALGAGSVADRPNSVSVGSYGYERQITNVAAGVAPTDAVNVSQLNAFDDRLNRLGATAFAFSALAPMPYDENQPTQISAGIGTYHGKQAMALGVYHYTKKTVMVNAAFGISSDGWEKAGRVGITWKVGGKARADKPVMAPGAPRDEKENRE